MMRQSLRAVPYSTEHPEVAFLSLRFLAYSALQLWPESPLARINFMTLMTWPE